MVENGRKPESELLGPPVPDELGYLWGWFREMDRTREAGHGAMQPLTHREIRAWAELMDRRPLPHEVDAMIRLDQHIRSRGDD